jgi:hypothetical protein
MLSTMNTNCRLILVLLLASLLLFGLAGCHGSNPAGTNQSNGSAVGPGSPPPQTQFERDLRDLRNGSFSYIFVFSRKDGKVLDKEDGAFLRKNAPQVVDMFLTDGGKKAIAGTNFNLELGNMELLRSRFVVEDYSGK